uniref:Uncharacterized protein n=1 Tax=Meloidogyne enterolobii TaxID=390850 RepID=A0A6V7UZ77_MELEN|nr:unnamed protein product [Meloidogyne enterolobii]
MNKIEDESKYLNLTKKIQVKNLFGYFYNNLLLKYGGGDLEKTNFVKWLKNLTEKLMKKPKIVKKKEGKVRRHSFP